MKERLFFILFIALSVSSCKEEPNEQKVLKQNTSPITENTSDNRYVDQSNNSDSASLSTDVGILTFEEKVYNFGLLPQGKKATKEFYFTNTGNTAINLVSVHSSCGCTASELPKDPILPGNKSFIKVEFDSKGKMGQQSQTVTVYSDGQPSQFVLKMRGIVVPKES